MQPENPETCTEALQIWDANLSLISVAMGDIGPSYEQMIQIMAFECLRFILDREDSELSSLEPALKAICKYTALSYNWMPSDIQAGLAINLASMVRRNGWKAAVHMAPPERRIVVKRSFP